MQAEHYHHPEGDFGTPGISYEDEGFQLGLRGDEARKTQRLDQLNQKKETLKTEHERLCHLLGTAADAYIRQIDQLISQNLQQKIDDFADRKNLALRDLVLSESGLRFVLKDMKDGEQKEKLIHTAIHEFMEVVEESKEAIRKLHGELEEQLDPAKHREDLAKHYANQSKLVEELLVVFQQGEQLEKAYSYGDAVRQLFETRKKS